MGYAQQGRAVSFGAAPQGLLLRKKKYAQYYLVEGKLTLELPSAAESLKQLREARAKDKSRTKRPPIAKGSPLLQVWLACP